MLKPIIGGYGVEKTFTGGSNSVKSVNIISLKKILLYGMLELLDHTHAAHLWSTAQHGDLYPGF